MEVKILCPCGSKYKFDVEPRGGILPGPVYCPNCGADGTELGNEAIAQLIATPAAAAAMAPPSPATEMAGAPSVIRPTGASRLSVSGMHSAAPAVNSPPLPPTTPGAVPSLRQPPAEYTGPSVTRGIVGAVIGGLIGMFVWTMLIVVTSYEVGWVAWGVGLFTGFCARSIGRGTGPKIGMAAAVSALVAILLGQFLAVRHAINQFADEAAKVGYEEQMESAKEAAKLTTDQQIRVFLAEELSDEDETVEPSEITGEQIAEFRKNVPKYKRMAAGNYSRGEYERDTRAEIGELLNTGFILRMSFSLWTFLWLFLGVGSAYRLASG